MERQAFNPFLPGWEYVPDGEPRVFGDRLYLYGSHDAFGGPEFCVNDYVCWSAPLEDLADWRFEGVIYRKTQDPRNPDGRMHMNAPDCVRGPDGRYYLFYQLHMLDCTCVAVSDSPAGPFEYHGCVHHPDGTPWGEKDGDTIAFDPGVLVDDDGKIYLYMGFSPEGYHREKFGERSRCTDGSVCLELEEDMITVRGGEHPVVPGPALAAGTEYDGHGFFEGSSIRKIRGRYYYIYSSVLTHELCYAVSGSPTGGFRFGGTLVSNADIGYGGNTTPLNWTGNTHGSLAEANGRWYVFYHRHTNRINCSRQACAEKITVLPDGSIPQAEITSCGLNAGPLCGRGRYEARTACNLGAASPMVDSGWAWKLDPDHLLPFFTQSGGDREGDGDQYLANLRGGSWCRFKYFSFDGSETSLTVTVRGSAGTLKVYTDRALPPAASILLSSCENWTAFSAPFSAPAGTAPLCFVYEGAGSLDFESFEIF